MDRRHRSKYCTQLLALVLFLSVLWWSPRLGGIDDLVVQHGPDSAESTPDRLGFRAHTLPPPSLSIEPYVPADLERWLAQSHPVVLTAAARHNHPELSGMTDTEFAEVLVLLLYNEHNGWFEDEFEPVRIFTPLYQHAQVYVNRSGVGSNFSVWPANLRPSVALEILQHQIPVPPPTSTITVPLRVYGSEIDPDDFASQRQLFAAITAELRQRDLAIEYLAANLERGMYRAQYEGVPISWRTLAAWHNQGIVQPAQIRTNPTAADYVRRTSAYLLTARQFVRREDKQSPTLPESWPVQIAHDQP